MRETTRHCTIAVAEIAPDGTCGMRDTKCGILSRRHRTFAVAERGAYGGGVVAQDALPLRRRDAVNLRRKFTSERQLQYRITTISAFAAVRLG
jgi:hypothetical protein